MSSVAIAYAGQAGAIEVSAPKALTLKRFDPKITASNALLVESRARATQVKSENDFLKVRQRDILFNKQSDATYVIVEPGDLNSQSSLLKLNQQSFVLLKTGRHYVSSDLEITCHTLHFEAGAEIHGAARLTITGIVTAGRKQHIFFFDEITEKGGGTLLKLTFNQVVCVEWFGALARNSAQIGPEDDSMSFQQACDALINGGVVRGASDALYSLQYPICLRGVNVHLDLSSSDVISDLGTPERGYSAVLIQIGNSREWNIDVIKGRRIRGSKLAGFENDNYREVTISDLSNLSKYMPEATGCTVQIRSIAFSDKSTSPGKYAIQFSNSVDCHAKLDFCQNASQSFGFGSDTTPRTPYAFSCSMHVPVVSRPNIHHSYYSLGFFGFAKDCFSFGGECKIGVASGSPDGNLLAFNAAEDCAAIAAKGICGRGKNGQGYLIGNKSVRCFVIDCEVSDAKYAFSFSTGSKMGLDRLSAFINCKADDVDVVCSSISELAIFIGTTAINYRTFFSRDNVNANYVAICEHFEQCEALARPNK